MFFNSCSSFDLLIGGFSSRFPRSDKLISSISYDQDDLTWCIKKAVDFPAFVNLLLITPPFLWIAAISIGYIICALLYIYMQLDWKYDRRNISSWSDSFLLIILPAILGIRNFTNHSEIRLYHALILIVAIISQLLIGANFYDYIQNQIPFHQAKSVQEILGNGFRLIGSEDVLTAIKENPSVSIQNIE